MSTIYCYMHVYMYNSIVNRMILCFNKHNSVFLHEPRRSFSISVPLYDMQVSSSSSGSRNFKTGGGGAPGGPGSAFGVGANSVLIQPIWV